MALRVVTVKTSGGDYSSLASAFAGEVGDLVAPDRQLRIDCYAMSDTSSPSTGAGWTTDATRFITIQAVDNHHGVLSTGVSSYLCNSLTIGTSANYTVGFGLSSDGGVNAFGAPGSSNVRFERCIGRSLGVGYAVFYGDMLCVNCMSIITTTSTSAFEPYAAKLTAYNCLAIGGGVAAIGVGTSLLLVNCSAAAIVSGGPGFVVYSGATFDAGCLTCASADGTSPSTGTGHRINQTFTFIDPNNGDYRLASIDAGAKGFGTDLSADATYAFSTDLRGKTRTAPWDIGAESAVPAETILVLYPVAGSDTTIVLRDPTSRGTTVSNTLGVGSESLAAAVVSSALADESGLTLALTAAPADESLLAISITAQPADEAQFGLVASAQPGDESLGALTQSLAVGDESLATIAQSATSDDESLITIAQTVSDPDESLGGIAEAADVCDESAGLASQSLAVADESLAAIAAAAGSGDEAVEGIAGAGAADDESLAGVASSGLVADESQAIIVQTATPPNESLSGITAAGDAADESLAGVATSSTSAEEALEGVAGTGAPGDESLGQLLVSQTATIAHESASALSQAAAIGDESTGLASATIAVVDESLIDVSTTGTPADEALAGVATSATPGLESAGTASTAQSVADESTAPVSSSNTAATEQLARVETSIQPASETLGGVAASIAAAQEWLGAVWSSIVAACESWVLTFFRPPHHVVADLEAFPRAEADLAAAPRVTAAIDTLPRVAAEMVALTRVTTSLATSPRVSFILEINGVVMSTSETTPAHVRINASNVVKLSGLTDMLKPAGTFSAIAIKVRIVKKDGSELTALRDVPVNPDVAGQYATTLSKSVAAFARDQQYTAQFSGTMKDAALNDVDYYEELTLIGVAH